ncbi:hypothetical protein [Tianweitania sediminis]|uniref:Uncharacterized protein n=1 Tax=Tianweitania sediminis TaxID=1502156 RepID=A0A8J7UGP7_9HYPH|nr:hypothetical protein [Tianweitania sediminis]MBP0438409.1 hypothetical protein [Tianweitania sediminis]
MAGIAIRSPAVTNNPALPVLKKDVHWWTDFNNGGLFGADVAHPASYQAGNPAQNDGPIIDTSEHANGKMVIPAGQNVPVVGGMLDFSGVTARATYMEVPASVAAAIYANAQRYLAIAWIKFPTADDWNSLSGEIPYLNFTDTGNGWQGGPEIFQLGHGTNSGVRQLWHRRAKATNSTDAVVHSGIDPAILGTVTQVALWFDGAVIGLSTRPLGGIRKTAANPSTVANSNDFSGLKGKFGIPYSNWSATFSAAQNLSKKFKAGRLLIEALGVSQRDPIAVAEADFAATEARGVFG